jgi:hypothetical protein
MRAIFITPEERDAGFEPVMWLRSQEMINTLTRLGVEVRPVTFPLFARLCAQQSSEMAGFKADFVTAPNFNYFLVAASEEGQLPSVLDKPVIALWDDPLGALANCMRLEATRGLPGLAAKVLARVARNDPTGAVDWAGRLLAARSGRTLRMFESVMRHPLLRHFSWDSGHIEAVASLELLQAQTVDWYPIATYRAFLDTGARAREIPKTHDVAFCGNVYPGVVGNHAMWRDKFLRTLTTRICERRLEELDRSVWSLMIEEIEKSPAAARRARGLHVDNKAFWEYYLFTVWHAANTLVRLAVLGGIKRDVNLFGLFADPQGPQALQDYPNLKYRGNVDHFAELPLIYASTRVNVCVTNGLVYKGISSKLIDCLASGGFALTDPKQDVREFFGPVAEKIFFRSLDELNSKIEYYLAHPREREEIVTELGVQIRRRCTLEALFEQVVARVS